MTHRLGVGAHWLESRWRCHVDGEPGGLKKLKAKSGLSTAPAIKPGRKRRLRSDQTDVDRTKSRINSALEARSGLQVMYQVPVSRYSVSGKLDRDKKQRPHA